MSGINISYCPLLPPLLHSVEICKGNEYLHDAAPEFPAGDPVPRVKDFLCVDPTQKPLVDKSLELLTADDVS